MRRISTNQLPRSAVGFYVPPPTFIFLIVTYLHTFNVGDHPTYVVVVYPPADSGPSKAGGPDCGACAEEEECMCSMQPVFRMHVDGAHTQCDFPVECFEAGKTFIVEGRGGKWID